MPSARSPRPPPRTWMQRASFQKELTKGTSGIDPQTQARILPQLQTQPGTGDLSVCLHVAGTRDVAAPSALSPVPIPGPSWGKMLGRAAESRE